MRKDQPLPTSARDVQALQAAYLRARHGLSQDEIRQHLGNVSQSHVSRLLAHATDRGWLEVELRFNDKDLPSADDFCSIRQWPIVIVPVHLDLDGGRLATEGIPRP